MALEYGTVTGRILTPFGDSDDIGDTPDEHPAVGTVTFTPEVSFFVDTTNDLIVPAARVSAILDSEGRLCNPQVPSQKYIKLIATNSATINPKDWTYRVDFALAPGQGSLPSFDTYVLANSIVDLSSLVGVPESTGISTSQMLAAVAAAEAAAEAAAASAAAAEALIASPQSLLNTPLEWRTLDETGLAYAGRPVTPRPVHWDAVRGSDGNWVSLPVTIGTTTSGTGMVPDFDKAVVTEDVETV